MVLNKKKEIERICKELAEKIREMSKSQKELWQLLPNLCLEADGRGGYSDHYQWAYSTGYWVIGSSNNGGYYNLAVDLITGDIVEIRDNAPLASDEYIIRYLSDSLDELNAYNIIADLKKSIEKREKDNTENVIKWRESKRKELDLGEVYKKRKKKLKIEFSFFD